MHNLGLIAVAGLVGVGKTTLAEQLSGYFHAPLIREEYDKNPFLVSRLNGEHAAALPCELCFLMSRARQLHPLNINPHPTVISDYLFEKNRLFARFNLADAELALYDRMESLVKPHIVTPRLVIFLHDTVENCLQRISTRGRDFEKSISLNWLNHLNDAYQDLFCDWDCCPVLRFDCARYDCRKPQTTQIIAQQILNHATPTSVTT